MSLKFDAEVAYLAARCRLILDAVSRHGPESIALADIRAVVDRSAAEGNVRGLRIMRRDLLEMSQVLPAEARAALDATLKVQEADDPSARPAS